MPTTTYISNTDDIIDSRNLLEYMAILDETDDANELAVLNKLVEDLRNNSSNTPEDGITLVRDSYFETYAQEFAEDIGAINRNLDWPINCIDWAQATRYLQMDYCQVDFDGAIYWVR